MMKTFRLFLLVAISAAVAAPRAHADNLDSRVADLEKRVARLETLVSSSHIPCFKSASAYVAENTYTLYTLGNGAYTRGNPLGASYEVDVLKQFKDSSGTELVVARVNMDGCPVDIFLKGDVIGL